MPMIACEHCDALNPSRATNCGECEQPLPAPGAGSAPAAGSAPPPLPKTSASPPALPAAPRKQASRRNRDPEAVERSRQRQEFARIKNIVFTVRSVYWAGCACAVVQLLVYHVMIAGLLEREGLDAINLVVAALSWGQLALMVAGGLLVLRAPFVWTLVGAGYWTLVTLQWLWLTTRGDGFLLQDTRVLGFLTMMGLLTFAFWFAVAQARRVRDLMAANPELQLRRQRLAPEALVSGGVAEEAEERRKREWQKANQSRLRLLLVAGGLLLLGGGGVWAMTRPPSVEEAAVRFAELWASGDHDRIGNLFYDGRHGRKDQRWQKGIGQRGWSGGGPKLSRHEVTAEEGEVADVRFELAESGGELKVRWQRSKQRGWQITAFTLPDLAVEIESGIAAFRSAWAAEGTEQLFALLPPGSRERMSRSIRRSLEKRGWLEQRPALGDVDPGRSGAARRRILFELGDDELSVVLEYWHPGWQMVGFRPPEQ